MTEYSNLDRLGFGYGGGKLNEKSAGDSLQYWFTKIERMPESFKDECYRTAKLVQAKAQAMNRPIFLLQSGGMDCEVMLKAFIDQGIEFQPISFCLDSQNSRHEMTYADAFCKRHGLKSMKHQVTLDWALGQRALFDRTFSSSVFMLCHMDLLKRVWEMGGMPVMGAGDVLMRKTDGNWLVGKREFMLAWYWFMRQEGIDGVHAFFSWTPEMLLSMLLEPSIERLGYGRDKNANMILSNARSLKYAVYRKHWPDLTPRLKYTGEELVKDTVEPVQEAWAAERAVQYGELWTSPYPALREQLITGTS